MKIDVRVLRREFYYALQTRSRLDGIVVRDWHTVSYPYGTEAEAVAAAEDYIRCRTTPVPKSEVVREWSDIEAGS